MIKKKLQRSAAARGGGILAGVRLGVMSITIKDLETLAAHFHFDIDEARMVIGKEKKTRTSTPRQTKEDNLIVGLINGSKAKKQSESGHIKCDRKPVKKEKPDKPDKPEKKSSPRGPSGYNLFVKNKGISFKEAGNEWKKLSDSEKKYWNDKAK